jgi:hypothetical protein
VFSVPTPSGPPSSPEQTPHWAKAWLGENFKRLRLYLRHTVEFTIHPRRFMGPLSAPNWDWDQKAIKDSQGNVLEESHESVALRPDRFISWMAVFYATLLVPLIQINLKKSQELMGVSLVLKLIGFYLYTGLGSAAAHMLFKTRRSAESFTKTWAAVVFAYAGPAFWVSFLIWVGYTIFAVPVDHPLLYDSVAQNNPLKVCAFRALFGYLKAPSLIGCVQPFVFWICTYRALWAVHQTGPFRPLVAALLAVLIVQLVLPVLTVFLAAFILSNRELYANYCL